MFDLKPVLGVPWVQQDRGVKSINGVTFDGVLVHQNVICVNPACRLVMRLANNAEFPVKMRCTQCEVSSLIRSDSSNYQVEVTLFKGSLQLKVDSSLVPGFDRDGIENHFLMNVFNAIIAGDRITSLQHVDDQ